MNKSTVFVNNNTHSEKTVSLCMTYNEKNYLIHIPKSWLKENTERKWQYVLPKNVRSLRIAESLYGISTHDLPTYPTNDYLQRLFRDDKNY